MPKKSPLRGSSRWNQANIGDPLNSVAPLPDAARDGNAWRPSFISNSYCDILLRAADAHVTEIRLGSIFSIERIAGRADSANDIVPAAFVERLAQASDVNVDGSGVDVAVARPD